MSTSRILLGGILAALCTTLHAQTLRGRVTNSTGTPLAGIPVERDAGAASTVTGADGTFAFTVAAGAHTIEVLPAETTLAPRRVTTTAVVDVGDIALRPGAALTGRVVNPAGLPVPNCNLDALDATNSSLFLPGDATDAQGLFSVVVPIGPTTLEVFPPVGSTLVARERLVQVSAATNAGTIELPQGFIATGSVRNGNTLLPVAGATVRTYDNVTDFEIPQLANTTNAFGAYSINVPVGVYRIVIEAPAGFASTELFGEFILSASQVIAPIDLVPGVVVTGTVTGAAGPIADCDIDAIDAFGHKLFTPNDNTNALGVFTMTVPPGTYTFQVDPPIASQTVGLVTGAFNIVAATNIGTLTPVPGFPVTIDVSSQQGIEFDADLDLFNVVNGRELVLAGDHADRNGTIRTIVPAGVYDLAIDPAQGRACAGITMTNVVVGGPLTTAVQLPQKQVRLDVRSLGSLTLPQSGPMLVNLTLQNMTAATAAVTADVFVRLPSGTELPIIPPTRLDIAPALNLFLGAAAIPLPTLPAGQLGHELRMYVRMRSVATGVVLDEAYESFVVQ